MNINYLSLNWPFTTEQEVFFLDFTFMQIGDNT